MKLHLPKVLFTAVVAAVCCVQQAQAETYYLDAGTANEALINTSFRTENGDTVRYQTFTSTDSRHDLIINKARPEGNVVKVDFLSIYFSSITVEEDATGNYFKRYNASSGSFYIGDNTKDTTSIFKEDFTIELTDKPIQLDGTQTWNIDAENTVTLKAPTINNTGTFTIDSGALKITSAITYTSTGTVCTAGTGKIVVDDYLTFNGTKTYSYSDTATGNGYATATITVIDGGSIGKDGSSVAVELNGQSYTTTNGKVTYTDTSSYWANQGTVTVGGDSASEGTDSAAAYVLNGAELNVTAGQSVTISAINAKSDLTIGNGATAAYKSTDKSDKSLGTVSIDGGTLTTQVTSGSYTINFDTLTVGSNGATIGNGQDRSYSNVTYNANYNIASLQGSGDFTVYNMSSDGTSTVTINGGSAYTGDVHVQTRGGRMDLDLASENALANSVIYLGGGTSTATNETNIVVGHTDTGFTRNIKGIQDADGRVSNGNVICRSGSNVGTLVIDTGDDSYNTTSGVKHAINLVKKGAGTQTFSGDMSSFGINDQDKDTNRGVDGTIEIQGGRLAFTKADGDMTVAALTLNGGYLDVTNSVTLNAVTVDFSKYFDDATKLEGNTYSVDLVTAGTLSITDWAAVQKTGTYTADGTEYTTTLDMTDKKLVLTFKGPEPELTSLTVDTLELDGTGTVLTLNIGKDLTGMTGDIDLTLSDAALATLAGLPAGDVSLLLQGTAGDPIDSLNYGAAISFYGSYVGVGGWYKVEYIPEPATATLSLLALAGLAARRRRK